MNKSQLIVIIVLSWSECRWHCLLNVLQCISQPVICSNDVAVVLLQRVITAVDCEPLIGSDFSIKVTNIVWIIMVIVVDVIVNISGYHTASISDLQMNSLYAVWFSVSLHDSRNVNMGPFCQVISIHCLRCPPCPLRLHQTWCPLKDCWCTSECIDSWKLSCYTDEAPEWADLRSFLLAASLCRNNSIDWTLLITLGVGMHLKG